MIKLTTGSSGPETRIKKIPKMTFWHGAIFFQVFLVFIYAMLAIWYYVVSASPSSISEYLPAQSPADYTTVVFFSVFALVSLAVFYVTWQGRRVGLLAGAVWGLVGLALEILMFMGGPSGAPNFSDFLYFPISVFGIIVCIMAWRSVR